MAFAKVAVIITFITLAKAGEDEFRLLHDLLKPYQIYERPVNQADHAVKLQFGVTLQQIIDMDERNQLLKSNLWLEYMWTDVNLAWNESEYGGIKDIRIPPKKIWSPDMLLFNSASTAFNNAFPTNVIVDSKGGCKFIPPGIFLSTCQIDITWFPFDDQACKMKFGSWTHKGPMLNVTLKQNHGDTSEFKTNGEWELLGFPAERIEYEYQKEIYIELEYSLKIRRRTLYYFSNLILPCVLIASMAVLGFYFPPESGEKITLEITILMSLTFFMNVVSDMQPPSSETPLIGTYFSCIMIMVASSVVCTILVLNYHHRLAVDDGMPPWFRKVFLQWIPWALRMSRPGNKITRRSIYLQNKMRELENGDRNSKSLLANVLDLEGDFILAPGGRPLPQPLSVSSSIWGLDSNPKSPTGEHGAAQGGPTTTQNGNYIEKELHSILLEIRVITNKIRAEGDAGIIENEWKFAAMVLDRVCLIAFTFFTVLLSAAVLIAAPHVIVF